MKHSVIIGSYNRPSMICQAIKSVMDQTVDNWELFIADDGSDQRTIDAINTTIGSDARCHLLPCLNPVNETGLRPNASKRAVERINDAIPHLTGDLVHYLPDDDWYTLHRFKAFEPIFENSHVHMAYGLMGYADNSEIIPGRCIFPGENIKDPHCRLDQTQVVHRRSVFERVRGWPTDRIGPATDGVFFRTLVESGFGPIYPVKNTVSYHRLHAKNMLKTIRASTHERE